MFKTIKRIMGWVGEYKGRLYLGFLCSFLTTWCSSGPIMLSAWVLNQIIAHSRGEVLLHSNLILISIGAMAGLIMMRFFFSYWRARLQESIGYEIAAKQRVHMGDILKRVSLGYFSKNSIGEILSAITTELSVLELQGMKMIDAVVNGYLSVAAITLFLFFFCPQAAVVSVAGILLSTLALHGISRQSIRTASTNHKAQEDLAGAVIQYVRGLSVVKSFGQQGVSIGQFKHACEDSKRINIRIEKDFVPWNCLHLFFLKTASVLLILVAAWQTLNGQMELYVLIMAAMFSFTFYSSVESINDAAHVLGVIDAAMDKLEAIEQADFIDEDGKDIQIKQYDIQFNHVSFGYEDREILHDISFRIPQNTTTAIVGPSGSGKSTICSLIARFYDVNAGSVLVDGHDVREFTCDSLLKHISMVFQNVYLFHDSIRNNIKFGKADASEEEMIMAAKQARCHDFIRKLPDGYDTIVGEGGSSLSGGEKQRISIARAMLKDAPVIILDEATASVDPENEYEIQEALSALVHGKTIITIAHRLATIEHADQILVVDQGCIVQQGTHSQLIGEEGVYRRFVQVRQRAEGWKI